MWWVALLCVPWAGGATTSPKFKLDLAALFSNARNLTVLELGVWRGYTTAVLADLFFNVIAVDFSQDALTRARQHVGKRRNVLFLKMNLYGESWARLANNIIDVVFIDAAHDYHSVKQDIRNSLQLHPTWIVFHDYGSFNDVSSKQQGMQVKPAVQEFEQAGVLSCRHALGEHQEGFRQHFGARVGWTDHDDPEGVACRVSAQGWTWHGDKDLGMLPWWHPYFPPAATHEARMQGKVC
jgi:SAM-dependent methyltransferase